MSLYNIFTPVYAPANRKIINIQADKDKEAAPMKNALMLQPPAMHAP